MSEGRETAIFADKSTVLFKDMGDGEIEAALKFLQARERGFAKGEIILSAGTVTEEMGLVLDGSVTIESNDIWGNRTLLGVAGKGEFFGEAYALLKGEPMLVDVRANEDCRVLFLRIGLLGQAAPEPWMFRLLQNILTIAAEKNLHLSARSFHTAPKTIRRRIMAYLNTLSLQKHSREFDIPFNRQQMADYLNLDRSALSNELGKMRDQGIIRFQRNHFTILPD